MSNNEKATFRVTRPPAPAESVSRTRVITSAVTGTIGMILPIAGYLAVALVVTDAQRATIDDFGAEWLTLMVASMITGYLGARIGKGR